MAYIDGFVIPVPTANRETYRAHEARWWPHFKALGAQSIGIGWGEEVPEGAQTDFRRAVALKAGETVAFGWMVWPDKATRDAAYAKMMEEGGGMLEMPFDGKRMIYGGFDPLLQDGAPG